MLTRSDDLDILLTVVDSGGFSAAADILNIQVARVSRAVSKIEQQLGVTILNRTTRRIELTDEGRQFVESVRTGLLHLQRAEDELVKRGELPQGRLRVDAASPFVFHQLVPLMQDFRLAYPDIMLELTSNEGYVDLLEKRTDVAIRIGKLNDSTLYARPLGKSALHIVASPAYIARRGAPQKVADLSGHELLGFTEPKALNLWPLKGSEEITPSISSSNGETLRQLALSGNGIACLSGFMINDDLAAGRLVTLLNQDKINISDREQVNAMYYKSSTVARRISAFIEFIQPRLTL
ncbi:LysR family transcriptional regulator [Shewanella saliphila]|uniref:LysR family transcriptional regulator n=1 Tax=Shewanella saliphila TaxID=2282698 RepID=A0ABQ2QAD1_9GAMM|nr:LysR family transcriptional regulator [Shewanella saliphila]MCL1103362.1 LysR family transcriptional regulator [Shewanella saliphila]GGP68648.1 LysR family transcriptional regulator [Shewanella saliphila]